MGTFYARFFKKVRKSEKKIRKIDCLSIRVYFEKTKMGHDNEPSPWSQKSFLGRVWVFITWALTIAPFLFELWWTSLFVAPYNTWDTTYKTQDEAYRALNLHPLFMTFAYAFFGANALIAFRVLPFENRYVRKLFHAGLHLCGILMSSGAIAVVVLFKQNTQNYQFYTAHSWVGLAVFVVYIVQWFLGFFMFLFPGPRIPQRIRAAFLPIHTLAGAALYLSALAAMISGVVDRLWIYQAYNDPDPDLDVHASKFYMGNVYCLVLIASGVAIFSHFHKITAAASDDDDEDDMHREEAASFADDHEYGRVASDYYDD
jgi:Eukaryotic cytochrome b561